ncbi:TIGR00296 family protein [Methanosarcina sp.]|uniref:TIGR00296 family protein n=1 Tax=Methanosarcina sp. TaxID=2213 RepID=UPI0029892CC7|nr:TIGR00296 family protein [Methanosarcina sp.]MDW5548696.1 TIGR00296 family protein [Methanosarcina sp.]MDW5553839.1 TIGR00296 family protein [Methanosarcina sp.]MDW5558835.1 TIGR00296 family protein [Methanosarcina sp.]
MLTDVEGRAAVKLARKTIELFLSEERLPEPQELDFELSPVFGEKRGVFVTLTESGLLRGCIGHPFPDSRLEDAIMDSAISAATQDPRFHSVRKDELDEIVVEVTVLTQPEKINAPAEELPERIEIGKHGLIVKQGYCQGLLLPQVAPEYNMDSLEFLGHTCLKAGLSPDAWLKGAEVSCFEGQIFKEKEPSGEVIEEKLQ